LPRPSPVSARARLDGDEDAAVLDPDLVGRDRPGRRRLVDGAGADVEAAVVEGTPEGVRLDLAAGERGVLVAADAADGVDVPADGHPEDVALRHVVDRRDLEEALGRDPAGGVRLGDGALGGLEPDLRVGAVAERLVLRAAAAAEPVLALAGLEHAPAVGHDPD